MIIRMAFYGFRSVMFDTMHLANWRYRMLLEIPHFCAKALTIVKWEPVCKLSLSRVPCVPLTSQLLQPTIPFPILSTLTKLMTNR